MFELVRCMFIQNLCEYHISAGVGQRYEKGRKEEMRSEVRRREEGWYLCVVQGFIWRLRMCPKENASFIHESWQHSASLTDSKSKCLMTLQRRCRDTSCVSQSEVSLWLFSFFLS